MSGRGQFSIIKTERACSWESSEPPKLADRVRILAPLPGLTLSASPTLLGSSDACDTRPSRKVQQKSPATLLTKARERLLRD